MLFTEKTPWFGLFFTIPIFLFGLAAHKKLKANPPLEDLLLFPAGTTEASYVDNEKIVKVLLGVARAAGKIRKQAVEIGKSIVFEANEEENAAVSVQGKTFKVCLISKIVSITLCILYFLPIIKMEYYGEKLSINGWTAAFGIKFFDMRIGGNAMVIVLLLIPIAIFSVYQFKDKLPFVKNKLLLLSAILSAGGMLAFIIIMSTLDGLMNGSAGMTVWSFLSFLLYLLLAVISFGCFRALKKSSKNK